jgi:uncharacterized protein with HEPN domain
MMMRDPLVYIDDILDAMEKAEAFTAGIDYARFEDDVRTVYAVIRALEIIGEAVKRLPADFREGIPPYPGKRWQGCGIKSSTAMMKWTCALFGKWYKEDIPVLKPRLQQILREHGG